MKAYRKEKTENPNVNSGIVLILSVCSKILSLVRDTVIASFAGVSANTDVYYMITSLYSTLESGFNTSIYNGFYPVYKQLSLEKENKDRREHYLNDIFTIILLFALVLTVLVPAFAHELTSLFAPGFTAEMKSLAKTMIFISAPTIFLVILSECFSAVLRSHNRFFISQCRELAYHFFAIVFVVFGYKTIGVYALCVSLVFGAIGRVLIQLPAVSRVFRYRFHFTAKNSDANRTIKAFPPIILTASITQLKTVVDKAMSSSLSTGSISTLHYGSKLESAIGTIIPNAICTGYFPEFVRLHSEGKKEELGCCVSQCLCNIFFFSIPLFFGAFCFRSEITQIVFFRGKIDIETVNSISGIFVAYMFGSLFYGVSLVISNLFYCSGDTKSPLIINALDLVTNVIFNFLLIGKYSALGLAIATSISSLVSCMVRIMYSRKILKINAQGIKTLFFDILKIVCSTFVAIAVSMLFSKQFHVINLAVRFTITCLLCVLSYLFFSKILHVSGLKSISNMLCKK